MLTLPGDWVSSRRVEALQGLAGGIPARRPADASPGVRTGAAQEQVFQRGAVLTIPGYRAHDQQLVQRHLTVIDAALSQAILPLQVKRGEHLLAEDELAGAGGIFFQEGQYPLCQRLSLRLPAISPPVIGGG